MEILNNKAWKILTEDEQLSLSLKHGYNKSSWEAGEIVGRAHYKFLEIEARAKQFLKMFSEHFDLYGEVIPDYVPMNSEVRQYFRLTIGKRLSIGDAIKKIGKSDFSKGSVRNQRIISNLERMLKSESAIDKNMALLIFDFDRWNNFRILPRDIQEPSAFKRRNKNYDIRNIRNLLTITPFSWKLIIRRYEVKREAEKILFMPIFSMVNLKKTMLRVNYTLPVVEELSKIGLFLFSREERAVQFRDLVCKYDMKTRGKSCVDGQQFWPLFREASKYSINYNAIKKRIPSRKFLESALRDIDAQLINPKDKDPFFSVDKRIRGRKKH
jgi:hypothetical protein